MMILFLDNAQRMYFALMILCEEVLDSSMDSSLVARQSRSIRYWYRYVVHRNLCMVSYPYVGLPVQVRIILLFIPEYMARWYVGYIILHMRTVKTPVVPVNRCNYSWTEGVPSTKYQVLGTRYEQNFGLPVLHMAGWFEYNVKWFNSK